MDDDAELETWAKEFAQEIGQMVNDSLKPLNDYLAAPDDDAARRVLRDHPDLASPAGIARLDRFIAQSRQNGDPVDRQRLEQRRRLLDLVNNAPSRTHRHRWEESKQIVDGTHLSGIETCSQCGTGYELLFTPRSDGPVRAELTVLPAAGETASQIHPEILARALQRREQAAKELRDEGLAVAVTSPRLGRAEPGPTNAGPAVTGSAPTPRGLRTPTIAAGAGITVLILIAAIVLSLRPTASAVDDVAPGGATPVAGQPDRSSSLSGTSRGEPTPPTDPEGTPSGAVDPGTGSDPVSGAGPATGPGGNGNGGGGNGGQPAGTAPGLPGNVSVTTVDSHTVRVHWTDTSTNEGGFDVNNGDATRSVGANTTQFDWGGLNPGTYMCFRVRATNAFGASAFAPITSPYYACTTTPVDTVPAPPSYVYPVNGQTLGFSGSYLFKVTAVPGASGYLFGFFQDGAAVWENYANEGTLSGTEYGIMQGSAAHDHFHIGDVQVWVRALVGGQWTDARIITIHLA